MAEWVLRMVIKQLSVFVENQPGRLAEISEVLRQKEINIRALSIADTTNFGILRMIVNHPARAESALREQGFTVSQTDVIAVGVTDEPGGLVVALKALADAKITVEYMYAFANGNDAAAVLKSDDPARVIDILKGSGFDVYSADEAYRANQ